MIGNSLFITGYRKKTTWTWIEEIEELNGREEKRKENCYWTLEDDLDLDLD